MRKGIIIILLLIGAGYACVIGYLFLNGSIAPSYLPGERPACMLQSYASPNHKYIATVWFKLLRSDDFVDSYDTFVQVGPVGKTEDRSVLRLFCSTCISCEWKGNDTLVIYYWGKINSDYPPKKVWEGITIRSIAIAGPVGHNPSRLR